MARKSERNKASADKSEKAAPTGRKPGRPSRRRKKSTSDSEPDPEVTAEETSEEIPLPSQIQPVEVVETPDTSETKARRGRPRKQPLPVQEVQQPVEEVAAKPATEDKDLSEWKEDGAFWGESSKAAAEPAPVETETSTWKIQSSNGSGGEIQKLKICRQRLTDSAESSSSPTKEIASPRRKRKERHLEADGESVGSHSDAETATATVVSAIPEIRTSTNQEVVDSTSTSHLEEITLPEEQAVITQEADSATEEKAPSPQPEPEPVTESVLEPESVPEPEPEHDPTPAPEPEHEHEPTPEHEPAPEPISEEAIVDNDVSKETEVVTESTEAIQQQQEAAVESSESMEVVVEEAEEKQITETAVVEEKIEQTSEKPVVRENQEAEEGELKQPPKPKDYSKLAVSNEDAMQQIAKKLNERAARFSKEATEEMKRTAVARPSKETIEEEDHEEGEISRDTSTVKKLELKRLNDDDNEPSKNNHSRTRRLNALTSPHDLVNQNEKLSQFDVSTETLKDVIGDQIELVTEEEVAKIFAPDDDEPEQRLVVSDEESGGDIGDAAPEEEGELVDNDKEGLTKSPSDRGKEDHNTKKAGSREPKRSERRVTKESPKKSSKSDRKERRSSVDEHKSKKKSDKENIKKDKDLKIKPDKPMPSKSEENHKPIRKIALVSDDAKNTIRRSISPPMKQPSQVLFITNLVRPFTIGQLRELLARTGTISPNGFYIDKIKSKCFVKYNDVEMAIETRHALHGVRWPVTNPRTLRVEFSSDEAMEAVKKLAEDEETAAKKQDLAAHGQDSEWLSERDVMKPAKKTKNSVREWDMGKDVSEIQETVKKGKEEEWGVKSREKRLEKIDGAGKRRAVSPSQEKTEPARKIKKRDNDAPAKLLDDLFRKTEATPCIYWLPLTASQIAVKEEIRRQHMAEHQKRLAEMKKTESMRREKDKSRDRDRERDRYRDRRRK